MNETVRTVWIVLDTEIPFWVGMLAIVVFYGGLAWLAVLFRRRYRPRRRPRYDDIPPVKVIPTRPDRRTLEDR